MSIAIRFFVCITATLLAVPASADLRTMGKDYRQMVSNYHMVGAIRKKCPDLQKPALVPAGVVEKAMQDKIGIQQYAQLQITLQQSSLYKDASATVNKLFEQLSGCDDERLPDVLKRVEAVHAEAYARFEQEPALVKPEDVPVPMRRN